MAKKGNWVEPTPSAPIDVQSAIDRLVELKADRAEAEKRLKDIKEEQATNEAIVQSHLETESIQSMNTRGMTFYLIRDMAVASQDGTDKIVERLIENDEFHCLLGVNHPKMKSFMKEACSDKAGNWEADQNRVPEKLRDVLRVSEFNKLGQRASSKK